MPLFQIKEATLAYGGDPLLDQVTLQVDEGERVCLLGRNGAGKTSLMRVITGEETPSQGELITPPNTVLTRLSQEVSLEINGKVSEVVRSGVRPEHHEEDWEIDWRLEELVTEMGLPADSSFAALSGGMKRRVLLAQALAGRPHVLLLDEPTNHLDLDSILWMENFLLTHRYTLFFVTHDRAFLRRMATRIVEIDRGKLTSWACDYDTYLIRKEAALEAEERQWATFDKKLALEESWLRQGVKARRTRNEGRVLALKKLRLQRSQRREKEGTAKIEIQEGNLSGQKVIDVKGVSFTYPKESSPVIKDFTTRIWRGDKIGIIGTNGSGKTTLLKLLLGQIAPSQGSIKLGTNLEVVYLDQLRGKIDGDKSVSENVAGDAQTVTFQGKPRNIHSYLKDFLFSSERIRLPARLLSGGERNRLLLAKLFLQPANLLVMDEPTNDLDLETMELLEDLLVEYSGTLLLVSHDRVFLDNVVTSTLVFEGQGSINEYEGGYEDWLRQTARSSAPAGKPGKLREAYPEAFKGSTATSAVATEKKEKPRKMLNREKKELEEMPAALEKLEKEQIALNEKLCAPQTYRNEPQTIPLLEKQIAQMDQKIKDSYRRWEELEKIRDECGVV